MRRLPGYPRSRLASVWISGFGGRGDCDGRSLTRSLALPSCPRGDTGDSANADEGWRGREGSALRVFASRRPFTGSGPPLGIGCAEHAAPIEVAAIRGHEAALQLLHTAGGPATRQIPRNRLKRPCGPPAFRSRGRRHERSATGSIPFARRRPHSRAALHRDRDPGVRDPLHGSAAPPLPCVCLGRSPSESRRRLVGGVDRTGPHGQQPLDPIDVIRVNRPVQILGIGHHRLRPVSRSDDQRGLSVDRSSRVPAEGVKRAAFHPAPGRRTDIRAVTVRPASNRSVGPWRAAPHLVHVPDECNGSRTSACAARRDFAVWMTRGRKLLAVYCDPLNRWSGDLAALSRGRLEAAGLAGRAARRRCGTGAGRRAARSWGTAPAASRTRSGPRAARAGRPGSSGCPGSG